MRGARERFGKYELISRLATGGMGETHLAELEGAAGITKRVVIKKMLPALSANPEKVEQFIQEARVSAGLSHGNIAQVFEFGEVDGEYYLAMEYVDGLSLKKVLERQRTLGDGRLPLEISAYLLIKLLEALQYAHTRTGPKGEPLGLVHRDVAPDNVMLSWEGEVKLVDFGVAKAKGAVPTEPGLVKGKVSYLSPEQARAEPLDGRSDIFSAGIVLYQLLTGEKPFQGSEQAVMRAIVRGDLTAVRTRAPDVPEPLARIAHRALATSREARYQTALEMQQALAHWLFTQAPTFTAEVVRELLGELFAVELEQAGTPFKPHAHATSLLQTMRTNPVITQVETVKVKQRGVRPKRSPLLLGLMAAGVTLTLGIVVTAVSTWETHPRRQTRGADPRAGPPVKTCAEAMLTPARAPDELMWRCGIAAPRQLGACFISRCEPGDCACESYVRSEQICGRDGFCTPPLNGTGCSDSTYYSGPPFECVGNRVKQSACMLRYLILHGLCG